MKKIFFVISLFIFALTVKAQEIKPEMVPTDVMDRFHHTFPQSVDLPVTWVKEKGEYKASLQIMDSPAIMVLDSLGRTKRIERKINYVYLPENAKNYMKKLDPTYEVVSCFKIVDDKEKVIYKTVVKIKSNITFDTEGKVVPKK